MHRSTTTVLLYDSAHTVSICYSDCIAQCFGDVKPLHGSMHLILHGLIWHGLIWHGLRALLLSYLGRLALWSGTKLGNRRKRTGGVKGICPSWRMLLGDAPRLLHVTQCGQHAYTRMIDAPPTPPYLRSYPVDMLPLAASCPSLASCFCVCACVVFACVSCTLYGPCPVAILYCTPECTIYYYYYDIIVVFWVVSAPPR